MKKVSKSKKKKAGAKKVAEKKSSENKSNAFTGKITQEKLDLVRQTIISHLWSAEEIESDRLYSRVENEIGKKFTNDFRVCFDKSLEVLLKHNLIEDVPNKKPKTIRLAQRIDE